jgi:hypothetical protein
MKRQTYLRILESGVDELNCNDDDDLELASLVPELVRCKHVRHVWLTNCSLVDERDAIAIGQLIGQCDHIETLGLARNALGNDIVARIAESLSERCQLRSLWLNLNAITDIAPLARALQSNSTLVKLNLRVNRLSDGIGSLCDMLGSGRCRLRELDLLDTDLSVDDGLRLAAALRCNGGTLQALSLGRNRRLDASVARALCEALVSGQCQLRTLLANDNERFGDEAASCFGAALADERCTLVELALNGCAIGDDGLRAFAEGLGANRRLESLRMLANNTSADALREHLAPAAVACTSLRWLACSATTALQRTELRAAIDAFAGSSSLLKLRVYAARMPLRDVEGVIQSSAWALAKHNNARRVSTLADRCFAALSDDDRERMPSVAREHAERSIFNRYTTWC